jgi:hypothetical protein
LIKAQSFKREKFAILGSWFVLLISVRLLMSFFLNASWVGTLGAVGVTFLIFYFALRYTPLAKYSNTVSLALRDWYKKKYIFAALAFSMLVL